MSGRNPPNSELALSGMLIAGLIICSMMLVWLALATLDDHRKRMATVQHEETKQWPAQSTR